MEGWLIAVIAFGFVFSLMALGAPIAFCILGGSILGLWLQGGADVLIGFTSYSVHHLMASYPLAVAPMFILIGTLAEPAGLAERCYMAFHRLLGHLTAGLLMATTASAALFGACCGSSVASAALFTRLALPELRRLGYQIELSLGAIATAGGLATLIPPSIMAVFYGILTNTSVGKVLLAGIIPGIILSIMLMVGLYLRAKLNPALVPKAAPRCSFKEKVYAIVAIWPLLMVFLAIVGGIYSGFCTPTEAGAIGASVIFIYSIISKVAVKKIVQGFHEAAALTAQIFILIIGGQMLSKVVSLSGITQALLSWMAGSGFGLAFIWVIFITILLILGAILDPISMLVLSVPMSFPVLTKLGVDPVALGIVVILLVEVAVITPPVGFNVYVVSAIAEVDPMVGFRGSIMFFFILLMMIALIILVPSMATFLPDLAFR
jgi:C4-dicarboxylate transporter, DctM subunit